MEKLSLSITGIFLSVLFIVPVNAGQNDSPASRTGKETSPKPGQHGTNDRISKAGAGTQLDERGKRSSYKIRAAEMKEKMLRMENGQQGQ